MCVCVGARACECMHVQLCACVYVRGWETDGGERLGVGKSGSVPKPRAPWMPMPHPYPAPRPASQSHPCLYPLWLCPPVHLCVQVCLSEQKSESLGPRTRSLLHASPPPPLPLLGKAAGVRPGLRPRVGVLCPHGLQTPSSHQLSLLCPGVEPTPIAHSLTPTPLSGVLAIPPPPPASLQLPRQLPRQWVE